MHAALHKLSPSITKMIRLDHSRVMATFHKFDRDASPERRRAIVESACTALEIHAQLEEEIFYPALAEVAAHHEALRKAQPQHDEMRRLIGMLRGPQASEARYAECFMELMRDVLHHVADEETLLLPAAELLMPQRLSELGARMTQRRLQLAGPRAAKIAVDTARALPARSLLMAGGLLAGGYLLGRALEHRRH